MKKKMLREPEIVRRVRAAIAARRLTLADAANEIGVQYETLWRWLHWEKTNLEPSRIAELLVVAWLNRVERGL